MRKLVAHLQTTLNNRIATAAGTFWEPFPWGQEEIRHVNRAFAVILRARPRLAASVVKPPT